MTPFASEEDNASFLFYGGMTRGSSGRESLAQLASCLGWS